MSYSIISKIDLLTKNEKITGKVQVVYEGTEVDNIQVLTLKLFNGGNKAIVKSDFDGPIRIEFKNGVKILSTESLSIKPDNLELTFVGYETYILIEPLLLNSKDSMTFKFIGDGKFELLSIAGRIKDINSIKYEPNKDSRRMFLAGNFVGGILVCFTLKKVMDMFHIYDPKLYWLLLVVSSVVYFAIAPFSAKLLFGKRK